MMTYIGSKCHCQVAEGRDGLSRAVMLFLLTLRR